MQRVNRILIGLMLVVSLTACDKAKQAPKKPVVPVDVQQVETQTIPLIKEYIGITKSVASVGIRARVQGFLVVKDFTEGKQVNKDQLLYVIDPKPFKAKVDHAKAVLASSIAERDYQGLEFVRMKKLVSQGNVAKVRYDKVKAQFKEAQAQVELSKADLEVAQINLGYCYMRSPVNGRIGEQMVDVGNLVGGTEDTLLAQVVQLNPIYVEFSPSVNDFTEIIQYMDNLPFQVTVNYPQDTKISFQGKTDLINNQANVDTSTVLMRASIENPKDYLLPGIYVNVSMTLSNDAKKIIIPATSVADMQGQKSVFVVGKDNKALQKVVSISGQYKEQLIVSSGLKVGDQLIVSNIQKLRSGQTIKIKKTK